MIEGMRNLLQYRYAPPELEPQAQAPNRLMRDADTAIGPRERKPRKVPSPAST